VCRTESIRGIAQGAWHCTNSQYSTQLCAARLSKLTKCSNHCKRTRIELAAQHRQSSWAALYSHLWQHHKLHFDSVVLATMTQCTAAAITRQVLLVRSSMYAHYCNKNINVNSSCSLLVAYMTLRSRSTQAGNLTSSMVLVIR
jgi:hypothetical protein